MTNNICRIQDFNNIDYVQQLLVLQNAKELLEHLHDKEGLPYSVYFEGLEHLKKAMNFVDDVLIHQSRES